MKVYRGPSSKPFSDDSHELVCDLDILKVTTIWHESVLLRTNVTKEPTERQAVAHILLEASDVLTLHSKLLAGLIARSANLNKAEKRLARAGKHLESLCGEIGGMMPDEPFTDAKEKIFLDLAGLAMDECESK